MRESTGWALALETSGLHGSVALLQAGSVVQELQLKCDQRSAQSLSVAIRDLLHQCQVSGRELDLIAVAHGPGSFTGLRVGLITAKTLAYAWQCEVIGVDTLHVIAEQTLHANQAVAAGRFVWAVLDAQRQQLFASAVVVVEGRCEPIGPSTLRTRPWWLSQLQVGDVVAGTGLKPLLHQLPPGLIVAPEKFWQPQAGTVGKLGWRLALGSEVPCTWQTLAPNYLRSSAAEENPKFQRQVK